MFLGRRKELAELDALHKGSGFKFVAIYGRRRVGKTALIAEFTKDKDCIFYISIESNDKLALESFSAKVFERYPPPAYMQGGFSSWDMALGYIAELIGNDRVILVIDEYPYLAAGNPSISSILQKHIDTSFNSSNLFLILCGSSMSFMQNQVLGYESPLYGRRSAQFHVEPFDYYDSGTFFPNAVSGDKMLAYAICGGIPQYLNAVAQHRSVIDGIAECFLKKSGILFEEPENLLKQELREPSTYNSLITAIANGASKLNEISTKSGEESKKTSKYLKTLFDLRLVRKEKPYGSDSERNSIYALRDNMFKFWYRFIPQNISNIEAGFGKQILERHILPQLPAYVSYIFEDACREYLQRYNNETIIPFMFDGMGRWWGTNPESRTQEEIDILADSGAKAVFGECKWSNSVVSTDTLSELKRKSDMFKKYEEKHFIVFSKSGFSKALSSNTAGSIVSLVDLQMMYEQPDSVV